MCNIWEYNIKTDIKEIWWKCVKIIYLSRDFVQFRDFVNAVYIFGIRGNIIGPFKKDFMLIFVLK